MSFHKKCLLIAFGFLYLSCYGDNSFNLNKLTRTWLVNQTSDAKEMYSCPFVTINRTKTNTTVFLYKSTSLNMELKINDSQTNIYPLIDSKNATGNLTIFHENLPYYVFVAMKIEQDATYLVMTVPNVPKNLTENLSKKWNETAELRNISMFKVNQESKDCKEFIVENIGNGEYPKAIPEVITWSDTATTTRPVITTSARFAITTSTNKPKNSGSGLIVSNFVVLISMLLCTQ